MNKIFEELKIGFLTDLEKECINFDKLKEEYIKQNKITCDFPSSVDALLEFNNELYLIEFKNMKYEDIENDKKKKFEIKKKVYESLLILLDLIDRTISFSRLKISFILVYKYDSLSSYEQNRIVRRNELANGRICNFGLESFKNIYFKDIRTLTKELFENFIENL